VAQVKGFDPPSCHSACPLLVVASSYTITTLAPSALGDVGTGVSRFMVVDDVFKDRGRLVLLGVLGMNRGLSPVGRAPQAAPRQARVALRQNSRPVAWQRSRGVLGFHHGLDGPWGSMARACYEGAWRLRQCSGWLNQKLGLDCPVLDDAPPPCARATRSCSRVC
jgi:hypothetical protein